jgi:hypothetical protein
MKNVYHNDDELAYWIIAGYFAAASAIALLVS